MTPPRPLALFAHPHVILLGFPPVLLRRDTARIASGQPTVPPVCSVSSGCGSSETTKKCPSHTETETKTGDLRTEAANGRTPGISEIVTNRHGIQAERDADGIEPEGWTEADAYDALDVDELDARPDYEPTPEQEAEALARPDGRDARACGRCCGSSSELDPARPGEFRICRACDGSGVEDDPDEDDGRCRVCWRHDEEVGGWADAGLCLDCADYGKPPDEPDPEDDPDPGDGGLGLPPEKGGCGCERFGALACGHDRGLSVCRCACHHLVPAVCTHANPHLYDGAECAACLLRRAA